MPSDRPDQLEKFLAASAASASDMTPPSNAPPKRKTLIGVTALIGYLPAGDFALYAEIPSASECAGGVIPAACITR
jgi:hypothetical protein